MTFLQMISYGDNIRTHNNSRFGDYITRDIVLRAWTCKANKATFNTRNSNTKLDVKLGFEDYLNISFFLLSSNK